MNHPTVSVALRDDDPSETRTLGLYTDAVACVDVSRVHDDIDAAPDVRYHSRTPVVSVRVGGSHGNTV